MADPLITEQIPHAPIRHVHLPIRAALGAAHDERPDDHRELVYVALHADEDPGQVLGWGECSALNAPTYTDEWAAGAYDRLTSGSPLARARHPMAVAAVEMALLDADLRAAGQ